MCPTDKAMIYVKAKHFEDVFVGTRMIQLQMLYVYYYMYETKWMSQIGKCTQQQQQKSNWQEESEQ